MVAGSDGDLDPRQPRDLSTPAIYTSSVSAIVQVSTLSPEFEHFYTEQCLLNKSLNCSTKSVKKSNLGQLIPPAFKLFDTK